MTSELATRFSASICKRRRRRWSGSVAGAMASASTQPRTRLHIGGLPRELLDDELRARFAPFGEVRSVEVLREKPESPFFRREGEGSGGEDSESDSEVVGRGGGGGRGGRGGRGGKEGRGNNAKRPSPRPPPCRGFAYVDLRPTDARSLNRCVTLYNGCKWKGGVLSVRAARPRFFERLKMERDGVDEHGNSLKGTKTDSKHDSKGQDQLAPLKIGDELEIDGRARREKVVVLFGKGAESHKLGASQFPSVTQTFTQNFAWREFEPSASYATLRRLGQLPEIERAAKARAAADEARFEKARARMLARLGKDANEKDASRGSFEEASLASSEASSERTDTERRHDVDGNDVSSDDATDATKKAREKNRFDLPRAFFASDAAAARAAEQKKANGVSRKNKRGDDLFAAEASGARSARERFGLGPVANDEKDERNARDKKKQRRRRTDSVEMRALAAFLGGRDDDDESSDDDDDDDDDAGALATAADGAPARRDARTGAEPPAAAEKRSGNAREPNIGNSGGLAKPEPSRRGSGTPRDPDEGGVPVARPGAKWWEAGSGAEGGKNPSPPARRAAESEREKPSVLARDFFRAAAPFAPFGTVPSGAKGAGAPSASGDESGDGSGEGGDDSASASVSVSEEALLRDWRGEDESDEASDGDESESGEPGVVDFD